MFKRLSLITTLVLVVSLVAGCATPTAPAAATPTAAGKQLKLAAIFPGTITDADYNTLGYNGIKAVEKSQGIKIAYSENVAVPDVERVMREYLNDGYNIIFTHGSQFISQTQTLATQFKDAYFIAETDGPLPTRLLICGSLIAISILAFMRWAPWRLAKHRPRRSATSAV